MKYNPLELCMIGRLKMRNNMIQMKLVAGLYLLMIKVEIFGTSCIYVFSCIGGYPYSVTRVWTHTPKGRRTIVMFYITLP